MEEEALTFSELRKIQKTEKRQEELSDLDDDFFLQISEYLGMKEDTSQREYKNAKRVLDKIIGLRQEKIVKNARISVKSDVKASNLSLLPREKEFYRKMKAMFDEFDEKVEEVLNGNETEIPETEDIVEEEEESDVQQEQEEAVEDGYEKVEIVAEVPEFMGTDLESYGPFEEGEEAEIPEDNAEILVNRGNAEVMTDG